MGIELSLVEEPQTTGPVSKWWVNGLPKGYEAQVKRHPRNDTYQIYRVSNGESTGCVGDYKRKEDILAILQQESKITVIEPTYSGIHTNSFHTSGLSYEHFLKSNLEPLPSANTRN